MRRPTLRDVAERAGVHPATASRALNPQTRELVNDETAKRVIRVAKSMGYRPNPIARSLKTARSASVGVVIPDLTNPLFPPIVRGVEDELSPAGYNAWIVNTDNDPEREQAQLESLRSRQVEGLIVAAARREHPLLAEFAGEGMPIVLVNRKLDRADIPAVTADDAAGVAAAMAHLVGLGHRRIAHIAGPQETSTGLGRMRAYHQALRDHGIAEDPGLVATCDSWTQAEGTRATGSLLDAGAEFTGVVAGNDLLALGCYDALEERGLTCPESVSVVGFNDIPFVDRVRPPLTTVHIPHYQIGVEAGRMLLDALRDPNRHPRSVLLPVSLVVRGSTAPPPAPLAHRRRKGSPSRRTATV